MYNFRLYLQIKSDTPGITLGDENGCQGERMPLGYSLRHAG